MSCKDRTPEPPAEYDFLKLGENTGQLSVVGF